MKVLHHAHELEPGLRGVCVAIGVFDGVHLGHQQVIRQTVSDARLHEALPVVVTFDRHPNTVVAPDRVPPALQPLSRRLGCLESLGVAATWVIHFDEDFSRLTGAQFVRQLATGFGRLHSVCVGSAFTFGHHRTGNVALLQQLGRELQFSVHGLAAVALDGQTISSTRIRDAIRAGDFDAAGQMLGRDYSLVGPVVRGDQLGRKLGFPTANMDTTGLVLPPAGVYAVSVQFGHESHQGVLNIGHRPTLNEVAPVLRVEAHLLDFDGDLYDQELAVTFLARLRGEQKFSSLETLRAQIAVDVAAARRWS